VLLPLMPLFLAGAGFRLFVLGTRAPRDTSVPDVVNMTQNEAKRRLAQRGLGMRVVKQTFDETAPAGTVIMSDPPPTVQVKQGKAVGVWISKGPKPAVVPNLLGLNEAEARARVREALLSIGAL